MINMLKSKFRVLSLSLVCALGLSTAPASMLLPSSTVYAAEASNATATIAEMVSNQNSDGGWKKNYTVTSGDWAGSTIDNGATYTEIRKLAAEYKKTKNKKYLTAATKGINFLLKMQYSNGGFPQIYKSSGYHTHITYNDNAMVNVLYLLNDASKRSGDFSFVDSSLATKCATAVENGVQCILKTQVKTNGKLTVWGQQHDKNTLKPAGARAYEIPSLCSAESVGIVNFLKTRPSTTKISAAINGAVAWFKSAKLTGIKVVKENGDVVVKKDPNASPIWGRFYQLGTTKPIFVGRDGVMKYKLSEIELERRTGYAWYGTWPAKLVK